MDGLTNVSIWINYMNFFLSTDLYELIQNIVTKQNELIQRNNILDQASLVN